MSKSSVGTMLWWRGGEGSGGEGVVIITLFVTSQGNKMETAGYEMHFQTLAD